MKSVKASVSFFCFQIIIIGFLSFLYIFSFSQISLCCQKKKIYVQTFS